MHKLTDIIGLKVVAVKGFLLDEDKGDKDAVANIKPAYILFDDKQTYVNLASQCSYDYHDCNSSARILEVYKDPESWAIIMENEFNNHPDATVDI